jgi:hypothetical protein
MAVGRLYTGPPPTECNVCHKKIKSVFYDAVIRLSDRVGWADVCPLCFHLYGGTLGTGCGQEWSKGKDGKYYKTEG